uniref:Uncharacterized protein n=1 Tax=Meloidogyne enterolobii TaxID=390850 RepID=A0A6V7VVJ2_MELEN|nr:unnamed protein product [Meloidogyne enterolobii]
MEETGEIDENIAVKGDLELNLNTLKMVPCPYVDIITEFADVEIFLISFDSLLLELCAHRYHNWILGGQTIVISEQLKHFLCALEELNAKFKIVVFSDLSVLFNKNGYLSFLYSYLLRFLTSSKWSGDIEIFNSPLDKRWNVFLHQLTPSFILMSLENASPREIFGIEKLTIDEKDKKNMQITVYEDIDFASFFISTSFQLINEAIPVVLFNAFTINFTSVMSFRFSTVPINIANLNKKIAALWTKISEEKQLNKIEIQQQIQKQVCECKTAAQFWAYVVCKAMKDNDKKDDNFEYVCMSVILSALVCARLGTGRKYLEEEENNWRHDPALKKFQYLQLKGKTFLEQSLLDSDCINFPLEDLWDGRMVLSLYKKIVDKKTILPLRLQKEFADLHGIVGFKVSIPTDVKEELLDQLSPSEAPTTRMDRCQLYAIKNEFLDQYIPDVQSLLTDTKVVPLSTFEHDYAKIIEHAYRWNFEPIGDSLMLQEEKQREYEKKQLQDARKARKLIWQRQNLSAWYQLFSDSLEGQGGQLLVDFSRVVKAPAITEDTDNENSRPSSQMSKKNVQKKEGKGAKKGGKPGAGGLSKKDQILQQNIDAKRKQQIESDKLKIEYATRLKTNTLNALDELLKRLDLDESKALCMYQKVIRYADVFSEQLTSFEDINQKREGALGLVESVKAMFVKYFNFIDEQQKEKILYLWASLGFGKAESLKRRPDKQMDLQIDLIHYQLKYGGRMIDVLTELATKKDDRVTGFSPDAWQRKMLDAVDQDKSALIVAPTSAGKTFVSYYCIEKVLRKSDDDVVVYISPSKPLTNQIVGSVYARFRGKAMSSGKVLYGIFNNEIIDNVLNCQVLVTIPECFEQILLSSDPRCQSFVSRIKYVILDEVHCINQKDTQGRSIGDVWEHIFLLIRCPFLALSATISNINELKEWLKSAECAKPLEGLPAREVELITYDERWSELELSLQRLSVCSKDSVSEENGRESKQENTESKKEDESKADWNDVVQYFNPFAVYKLEKLRMFGIPADQRLTARQILELYEFMANIDDSVKKDFEPTKYFTQLCRVDEKSPDSGAAWLNRKDLRQFENALKNRFVQWMNEDKTKIDKIFEILEKEVGEEFEKRSKPYDMRKSALNNILPLIDQLKRKEQLPALCFNDDRDICEKLAKHIFNELKKREETYKASPEFQKKYNLKAEEKALKLAKRKRDEEERAAKRKSKRVDEDGNEDRFEKDDMPEDGDAFALMKIRMREDLERFKLCCRWSDEDIYNRCIEKLSKKIKRPEARSLLTLFERGIGFHHDGLSNAERSAVEVLFRRGFLGIVFSTSTLALGMNLPCKTVIFGIDTPKLNPLQFRQMSGRAGRRGFDPAGTVIFMSLPTNKIRRLLTASLATLRGNVPFTTAFLLRLISFVNGELSKEQQKLLKNARTQGGGKSSKIDNNDVLNEEVRRKAALTLLKVPFVLQTHNRNFSNLLRFLTFFYVQLLRRMQLLDEKCIPRGFAHFALHLSQYDPGSLVFIHIFQTGVLHRYIHTTYEDLYHEDNRTKAKEDIIFILAHIFTQKLVSLNVVDEQNLEKEPVLPALPDSIEDSINEYNKSVEELALASLQLGSINRRLENPIIALSGCTEESLHLSRGQIDFASVFNSDLQLDERFIPFVYIDRFDHRGRKIYKNSYALDFWKNPDADALVTRNRLSVAERWYLINEFSKLLSDIAIGIDSIANKRDDLHKLIVGVPAEERLGIADEYEDKFRKAFNMKRRFVEEKTGDAETSEKKELNIQENE